MSAQSPGSPFSELYADHNDWLRGWLRRRLDCSETAAELAQDTFVRLLQRQQRGERIRQPRAFLATIAHGLLVNHWRRLDIERAYREALASQPEAIEVSPEERQRVLETLFAVDALLRQLPDRVRRAFLMSQLDGLTYRRIGAELGVSERMVKKYMARAMYHCLTANDEPGIP
jgi:RNA polymerase sigma-70 factor (ECF subfamily)